jgi:hypothetical protein
MVRFDIETSVRVLLLPVAREFQAAVQAAAQEGFGEPKGIGAWKIGIGKYEGGVRVNGREIAIHRDWAGDDWNRDIAPKPEEEAVAMALGTVSKGFLENGPEWLAAKAAVFQDDRRIHYSDPLRSFFELAVREQESAKAG